MGANLLATCALAAVAVAVTIGSSSAIAADGSADPRIRELTYDGKSVIAVQVARGVATAIELSPTDAIAVAATGVGADCAHESDSWCIAALPNTHTIFVKPKSFASGSNNLQLLTAAGRSYTFRFDVLPPTDPRPPVYRLTIKAAQEPLGEEPRPSEGAGKATIAALPVPHPDIRELVRGRLAAPPRIRNTRYSVALGKTSDDIVPSLVFDDGRFTYLRLSANREMPAVFQVSGDDAETLVNARVEGDLLVVDRVARRLNLRLGRQVVGVFNEAFDADGVAPIGGTTVTGLERIPRTDADKEPRP